MRNIVCGSIVWILCQSFVASASTSKICSDGRREIVNSNDALTSCKAYGAKNTAVIRATIDKGVDFLSQKYEECKANNGNCADYKIKVTRKNHDGTTTSTFEPIDLTNLGERRAKLYIELDRVANDISDHCLQVIGSLAENKCFVEFEKGQANVDSIVNIGTLYLAKLFPTNVTHVDVGDLLEGKKLLGGDGAFLVAMRDSLLSQTGISGDFEQIIKDPLKVSSSFTNSVTEQAGKILKDICGDLCGNWRF